MGAVLAFVDGELATGRLGEIDRHLDECSSCRLLAFASHRGSDGALSAECTERMSLQEAAAHRARIWAPQTMVAGRYQITRFIGCGGMGEVYAAVDRTLGAPVAIKTLRSSLAVDARAVARFRREALLARRVTHPSVCRTYDIGSDGDVIFLTMELLEGETLGARLRREGTLSLDTALEITVQLAAALDSAHRVGVIHRDFKPDNVMMLAGTSADGVRIVITDFGLARLDRPCESQEEVIRPASGRMVGTPRYMAPEQVEGSAVTSRTDLYALGVVVFEMLTGHLPFDGPTPFVAALRRLRDRAPPPSRYVAALPGACDTALQRCLARDPRDRFASAQDFVAALSGEVAHPSGPSVRPRSVRALVAGAASIVALLVAGNAWRSRARGASIETPNAGAMQCAPAREISVSAGAVAVPAPSVDRGDEPSLPRRAPRSFRTGSVSPPAKRLRPPPDVPREHAPIDAVLPPPRANAPDDLLDPRRDDQLLDPYGAHP